MYFIYFVLVWFYFRSGVYHRVLLVCFSTCLESLCEVLVVIEIAFVTSHYKPNKQFKKDF